MRPVFGEDYSLSIFNVTALNHAFKLSDIKKEFPSAKHDSDGFLVNTSLDTKYNMEFIQLIKFTELDNRIFMLQGSAPKQTFFRSEHKFKKSMNTATLIK